MRSHNHVMLVTKMDGTLCYETVVDQTTKGSAKSSDTLASEKSPGNEI